MHLNYDLHSHSTASDGTLTPAQLVRSAASAGVDVLALTDHDTLEGIPAAVAEARRAELMEAQQKVHFAWNQARVGGTLDVLIESVRPVDGIALGRSPYDAPDVDASVHVGMTEASPLEAGQIVPVRVTEAHGYDLVGTPLA